MCGFFRRQAFGTKTENDSPGLAQAQSATPTPPCSTWPSSPTSHGLHQYRPRRLRSPPAGNPRKPRPRLAVCAGAVCFPFRRLRRSWPFLTQLGRACHPTQRPRPSHPWSMWFLFALFWYVPLKTFSFPMSYNAYYWGYWLPTPRLCLGPVVFFFSCSFRRRRCLATPCWRRPLAPVILALSFGAQFKTSFDITEF